ncbi:S-layer homology domain-containing protein [Paenibacillus sp. NPDC058174]|uniref:S-layer homology domain-containing protein n=1 Tax=Paenibacillus sp. NPDC058174 TaxID=3346366 RepID=UPI0036DD1013
MKTIWKKSMMLMMVFAITSMAISVSAFAHNNKREDPSSELGNHVTAAEAVTMIVKSLKLNIDTVNFIKKPEASDFYSKVKNNAPYAQDFIIANFNGLNLPKEIDPSANVTKEQFAKWLYGALSHTGQYVWIQVNQNIADADQVTNGYLDSIQKLLIGKIITLDGKQKFYPKNKITRTEASNMVSKAVKFIKDSKLTTPDTTVLNSPKLTSEWNIYTVNTITLTAQAPHSGYGLEITGIQFVKGDAIIQYRAVQPDPDKTYPQVITELKAVTYIPSGYKAVLGAEQPVAPYQR